MRAVGGSSAAHVCRTQNNNGVGVDEAVILFQAIQDGEKNFFLFEGGIALRYRNIILALRKLDEAFSAFASPDVTSSAGASASGIVSLSLRLSFYRNSAGQQR